MVDLLLLAEIQRRCAGSSVVILVEGKLWIIFHHPESSRSLVSRWRENWLSGRHRVSGALQAICLLDQDFSSCLIRVLAQWMDPRWGPEGTNTNDAEPWGPGELVISLVQVDQASLAMFNFFGDQKR